MPLRDSNCATLGTLGGIEPNRLSSETKSVPIGTPAALLGNYGGCVFLPVRSFSDTILLDHWHGNGPQLLGAWHCRLLDLPYTSIVATGGGVPLGGAVLSRLPR